MSRDYIKDDRGRTIGSTTNYGGSRTEGWDSRGRRVGTYNSNDNRTYDAGGKFIGTGNQLMTLITE